MYLWYDALGEAGVKHREEVENFTKITKADGIRFHSLTYQELIIWLANNCGSEHKKYINYITSRYL